MEARLVAVDSKVALAGGRSSILETVGNLRISSIVCQENEDKSETVFFVGGQFNEYTAIDYVAYEAAKAAVVPGGVVAPPGIINPNPTCNGIIKLTLKCEYDADDTISKYNQASVIEPIDVNAAGNLDRICLASLQYGIINKKKYLFCLTGFLNAVVYTRLNIFDIESKKNVIQTPDILVPPPPLVTINNYISQSLLLTKDDSDRDNVQNVLIISISTRAAPLFTNYTFTCNVTSLNKDVAAVIQISPAASNENVNIGRNNIITDMFYMEDNREVYIAHQFVLIANPTRTEYPLTVRSNYQALGEWKLESKSKDASDEIDEIDKFDDFIDKVIEMRKIFKLNPSMNLFLQDIDVRDYDGIDSKITKTRLDKMNADLIRDALSNAAAAAAPLSGFGWFVIAPGHVQNIIIDSPCNDIDKKIKNIMDFVYALKTPSDLIAPAPTIALGQPTTDAIAEKMYHFINDLLFMLVYTGCNKLAELICNDYVNLVITPPAAAAPAYRALDRDTWRLRFEVVLGASDVKVKTLIENIAKKEKIYKEKTRITPDISYDFKICSDSDTHTGVAYLVYNYNQNLNSLITLKSQDNLKNKIYEYGKDTFFSSNEQFYTNNIIDNIGNTMEQIVFCSFYKFERKNTAGQPFGDIGNADSETIYISVNIQEEEEGSKKINSGQVFKFLDIIRKYFVNLSSGAVIVDIGISGPIKRLIIGGDFGCNLLNDVVCRKFKSKQMKIYTREDNNHAFSEIDGTNHIFMIDVDLELVQVGGGNGDDNNNQNNHKNQKRICIGECINMNRVVTSKRKTRRKVPLLLSSS